MANVQSVNALELLSRPARNGDLHELERVFSRPLALSSLNYTPKRILSSHEAVLTGLFALVLHGAVIVWLNKAPPPQLPVVPPDIPPMTIEFSQPAPPVAQPPPHEPISPPVVEQPPPVEDELAVKPPQPQPTSKPKTVPKPVAKPVEQPLAPPAPPQPVAAPVPPAPPAPKPVTSASASVGYLKNPAPEYPSLAMRRGWEGTVLLRVHVMASGKPSEIQIQKSSGRDQLDDAALAAVKRWSFVPAKQGDVAQDGWVSVPIDFKIK
ncbi:energy transducer TonB [Pseudomonas sp. DWRC2-2]|uniref:energy transducer TonB n=1 Tax=Pseudomonas sp. DWRC2-2 TaxID=2804567 RepID=UPI003CF380BC